MKPTAVKAFGRSTLPGEAETSISAIFDFPNECTANLLLSSRAAGDSAAGNNGGEHLDKLQHVLYLGERRTKLEVLKKSNLLLFSYQKRH